MNASVKAAVAAVVAGTTDLGTLKVLQDNGCPIGAVLACGAELKKLSLGQMLSKDEQDRLVANGANLHAFLGLKPKAPEAAPAATAVAVATVDAQKPPTLLVDTKTKTESGNRVLQEVPVENDPFSFILQAPESATADQKKALRSLYNSFVSRAQTKIVEGYRNALKTSGIEIDSKTVSEAMKDARSTIGLDKMLDGVLSKKGFVVNRDEQDTNLIDGFRTALEILGVKIDDAKHAAALEAGRAFSRAFSERAIQGLKARGLAFA